MIKIGLMDWDTIYSKVYRCPNYDLGLTYAYLKKDKSIDVKLITSLDEGNLIKYDEIYIFKRSKIRPHPMIMIKNYYKYNIKEYGHGFLERDIRPFFKETCYINPDFSCYNPILKFSIDKPYHKLSWKIHKSISKIKYEQVKLFEEVDGEFLNRDVGYKSKHLVIHDNITTLFNNYNQFSKIKKLLEKNTSIIFSQELDISKINSTNTLEQILRDKNLLKIANNFIITEMNTIALWFISQFLSQEIQRRLTGVVLIKKEYSNVEKIELMLRLNYYNYNSNKTLKLKAYYEPGTILVGELPLFVYNFISNYSVSRNHCFYEYLITQVYRSAGASIAELNMPVEERYTYLEEKYGVPSTLQAMENIMASNKIIEEYAFLGGKEDGHYKKNYDKRRSTGRITFSIS